MALLCSLQQLTMVQANWVAELARMHAASHVANAPCDEHQPVRLQP